MGKPGPRRVDEELLDMLALRTRGLLAKEVGDRYGRSKEYVRAATNRVVSADAEHHPDMISFGE